MALKDPPCVRPGTREVSIKRFTANDPGFRGKYNTRGGPFSPIDTIDQFLTVIGKRASSYRLNFLGTRVHILLIEEFKD